MNAFGIWAILLTAAYIIYYPVVIYIDLFGKRGRGKKAEVEEFAVSDGDGSGVSEDAAGDAETPTPVTETSDGSYQVGDAAEDMSDDDDYPDSPTVEEPVITPAEQAVAEQNAIQAQILAAQEHSLKGVAVTFQESYDSDAYLACLSQPMSDLRKSRIKSNKIY